MTEARSDRKKLPEARPLETRHAFLDTQVYRKLKHNPANRALKLLAEQIAARRVVLHTTDITLQEISRQITENVEQTRVTLSRARRDVDRWRHTTPDILPMPDLNPETARKLFAAFRRASCEEWLVREHRATDQPAAGIFEEYFARKPPFDTAGSKEFPDAFVLKSLEAWCSMEAETMYVVTKDAAILRYVKASQYLLPLETIEELLGAAEAAAADDDATEAIIDALLNAPEFDDRFQQTIEAHLEELMLIYSGDLPEGETTGVAFGGVIRFISYQIVSRTRHRVGLLVNADVELDVDVAFENRRFASYDREDDSWIGGEWDAAIIQSDIALELYLEMDVATGEIVTSELIRNEYHIS